MRAMSLLIAQIAGFDIFRRDICNLSQPLNLPFVAYHTESSATTLSVSKYVVLYRFIECIEELRCIALNIRRRTPEFCGPAPCESTCGILYTMASFGASHVSVG